jgi:glycosyltransferase involved in cell wall biosynthesis
MNLAICIPISWDYVPTPFLVSLTQLLRPGTLKAVRGLGVERYFYLINRAFPLDVNRNTLVKKARELEADWVLFLDADMTFPPDLVPALLNDSIATGAAIVSATYFKKLPPHPCVSGVFKTPADPQLITPIEPANQELTPCDVIGLGAALIHCSVFDAVPHPWFEYEVYQKTGERTVTEDVPFCRKAKEAGFSIITDPRLVCGHIRQVEIDDSHWRACGEMVGDR